ncbi:MAG: PAS domain S-box protein [Candidatus Sumerlaeaceae bacterium]
MSNSAQEQIRFQGLLLDQVRNAVIATDPAGVIIYWNRYAETIYQWKEHEVLGRNITEILVPPHNREQAEQIMSKLPETSYWEGEFETRRKDGSTFQVYTTTSVFYDENGHRAGAVGVSTDLTERKMIAAELVTRNLQLSEAQALAHLGTWDWDVASDRITWSDELYRLFGVPRGDVEPTREVFFSLLHPDDRPLVQTAIGEALSGRMPCNVEFRLLTSDGAVRFFHSQCRVTFDHDNRPVRMVGMAQDITERKQAEIQLLRQARRSEAMLRTAAGMTQHLEIGTLLSTICIQAAASLDVHIAIIYLYEKTGNLLRYAADIGITEPLNGSTISCELLQTAPDCGQLPAILDTRHPAFGGKDNSLFGNLDVQSVVLASMRRDEKLIGVLGVMRPSDAPSFDPDDLQLLQSFADQAALAVANAQLYDEVRGSRKTLKRLSAHLMQHQEDERRHIARELHDEMGQALTAIKINLQLLQQYPDPDNLHSRLGDSVTVVDRLFQQVRSLSLNLHPPLLDDFGLEPALEWFVSQCRQSTNLKITFTCDLQQRFIPAMEIACFRVAQEAITNVIRHANAQKIDVSLQRRPESLELVITDDGVGFDAQATHARADQGLSMGLVSMSERVAFTGGKLEWESSRGSGTVVHATFPLSVQLRGGGAMT